jgi:hypothetical protein
MTRGYVSAAMLTASAAAVMCGLCIVYVWDPANNTLFPSCPFRVLTSRYCPGCGSLRATHRLMHGRVWEAFRLNPLMVLSLPLLGYAMLSSRWPRIMIPWADRFTRRSLWPWMILVVIVLYWLLRNLPWTPFSWLAPQAIPSG